MQIKFTYEMVHNAELQNVKLKNYSLTVYKEREVILTGISHQGQFINEKFIFDIKEGTGIEMRDLKCRRESLPVLKSKRYNHQSFVLRDYLFLVFGCCYDDSKRQETVTTSLDCLCLAKDSEKFFQIPLVNGH